jgi:hypothetical protein
MRIKAQTTTEVTISDEQMRDICIKYITERFDIDPDTMYVENGKLIQEFEVSAGNHSYFEKNVLKKKASQADITLLGALKLIRDR